MPAEPFDRLLDEIEHGTETYEFGETIREIPVDLLTYKRDCFTAKAKIMQDTRNPCLVGTVKDKETDEEYHYSFSASWLNDNDADWLAGVVCRVIADTVYNTKNNYKNRLNKTLKGLFNLAGKDGIF